MASSDLPELIGMSDRVLILSGERQAGIVPSRMA
jgi:ABC-type sugar transport system ATPase subunit